MNLFMSKTCPKPLFQAPFFIIFIYPKERVADATSLDLPKHCTFGSSYRAVVTKHNPEKYVVWL